MRGMAERMFNPGITKEEALLDALAMYTSPGGLPPPPESHIVQTNEPEETEDEGNED